MMSAGDKRRMGLANILASALTVQGLFFCAFVPTGLAGRYAPPLQGTHPSEAEVCIVQNAAAILPWRTVVDARLRSRRFPDARNPGPLCNTQQAAALAREIIKTGSGSREGAVYTINV